MDELISQLNKLDINKEVPDESIDEICNSLSNLCKISNDFDIKANQEDVTQAVNIISKLSFNKNQVQKLDNIGLLISNLIRKIKCYEFPNAYTIPNYVY
jgi:hypothetical protein